jgi:hypothetical protein
MSDPGRPAEVLMIMITAVEGLTTRTRLPGSRSKGRAAPGRAFREATSGSGSGSARARSWRV